MAYEANEYKYIGYVIEHYEGNSDVQQKICDEWIGKGYPEFYLQKINGLLIEGNHNEVQRILESTHFRNISESLLLKIYVDTKYFGGNQGELSILQYLANERSIRWAVTALNTRFRLTLFGKWVRK